MLKLRDVEVANDDYERQARHTTSSLEDMESKYNQMLERSVMNEEEIKAGEQEREGLRIETQRLRDELSDLKIEAEITQEKLRNFENQGALQFKRISQISGAESQTPQSPASAKSTATTSTNAISTPAAPKSEASATASGALTPPSPPLSEASVPSKHDDSAERKKVDDTSEPLTTPRPRQRGFDQPRHLRGPSLLVGASATPTPNFRRSTMQRPQVANNAGIPRDRSLYQIRGLIGKMQKLEERVHSARSKLPAPTSTPPRASPRGTVIPSSVTVRSNKKRSGSNVEAEVAATPTKEPEQRPIDQNARRLSHRNSRISMGTSSHDTGISRPSSRASISSQHDGFVQPSRSNRASLLGRPPSRTQGTAAEARRPRSSLAGRETPTHSHRSSTAGSSVTDRRPRSSLGGAGIPSHRSRPSTSGVVEGTFFDDGDASFATPTARRTTITKDSETGIPTPKPGLARRESRQMLPPARKLSQDVGETF